MGFPWTIAFSNFTLNSSEFDDLDYRSSWETEVQNNFNLLDSLFGDVDLNDFNRPVLKHGPRSLKYVRVFEWLKLRRVMKVKTLV